jgi:hypothetical protein
MPRAEKAQTGVDHRFLQAPVKDAPADRHDVRKHASENARERGVDCVLDVPFLTAAAISGSDRRDPSWPPVGRSS